MVYILYKLYVLLPYTYPKPKLSPHRRRCIYIFPQKTKIFPSVWFISVLNYGDTENVLINHLLLVIPMSYPCHYTNLCPHKPHKHAHTHTHTHTHTCASTHAQAHTHTHTHTHTHIYIYISYRYIIFFSLTIPCKVFHSLKDRKCILIIYNNNNNNNNNNMLNK